MDPQLPLLDVLLITHNQERYIARAVESIMHQKVSFSIRVVVADDSSNDLTLKIIRQYADLHPEITFTVLPEMARLGVTKNYQRGFSACSAEYVAVLEGDDYWCSPYKLALQVQYLVDHPECAMCGCNYYILDEANRTFTLRVHQLEGASVYDTSMIIRDNVVSNFSTSIYRRKVLNRIPQELFDLVAYDWAVNICVGIHGFLGFLNEPLSVYRVHKNGAWNGMSAIEQLKEQLVIIPEYDHLTGMQFHAAFTERLKKLRESIDRPPLVGRLREWCPPIGIWLMRGLLPPAILRRARSLFPW
jgi:glycosyltransferase involved in cell wall biosynthesis